MSAPRATNPPARPNVIQGIAPPHSIEAEQSVLGAILLSEKTHYAYVIEANLRPEDFYRDRHRVIYQAMHELYDASEPIDVLTVTEHLRARGLLDAAGGQAEIDALAGAAPAVPHLRHYGQIVKNHALLRRLLTTTYEIQSSVHNHEALPRDIVEHAERAILEVAHDDRQKDFRRVGDVLHEEIDKWHLLSTEGRALTGTPSGFADLDEITGGFQPGNLIVVAARPSMGKCMRAGSLVYDPVTGARRPIETLVRDVEGGEEAFVAAMGPGLKLRTARVTAAYRNGRRPVHRLTTRLGRRVEATANHPLLTLDGWRRLDELRPGDRIAVPRRLPRTGLQQTMPDEEIVVLAALVADGYIAGETPQFCWGKGSPVIDEVHEAATALGVRVKVAPKGWSTGYLSAGPGTRGNPVHELCERHSLWGKRSGDMFVPDAVFGLDEAQIARFLAVLYGCDGHLCATERLRQGGYSTISEQLARDVQHLLLRLGIVSRIRRLRRAVYDGTDTVGREVLITGQEGVAHFVEMAAVCGKSAAALATSDVWWDEVASIEHIGEDETYDLTIPGDHNFVVDDVIVHNSALVTNIAESVALHPARPRPVALFSLEMSEAELAQRFIASQASIKGDDLRKGRLKDERKWKRVLDTSARYDAAPLYVDDSSDIGILEIRAKSRRLHSETMQQQAGLGLIIVDYLQLMRPDGRVESRVEQVGQMSRGLKILARELNVPVVALSQLSRGVESRTDKRPLLSDLRECVTGDTLVLLADGGLVPIGDLVGKQPDVVAVENGRLVPARSDLIWRVGRRATYNVRLSCGRMLRATGKHRLRSEAGWQRIGELAAGTPVAVAQGLGSRTVSWSPIVAIDPAGEEDVYDLTVPGPACWLADGIVSHNSGQIEQDADLVMFIYRDEYYNENTDRPGEADLIIAKHRNGGLGDVRLTFQSEYPRFLGLQHHA